MNRVALEVGVEPVSGLTLSRSGVLLQPRGQMDGDLPDLRAAGLVLSRHCSAGKRYGFPERIVANRLAVRCGRRNLDRLAGGAVDCRNLTGSCRLNQPADGGLDLFADEPTVNGHQFGAPADDRRLALGAFPVFHDPPAPLLLLSWKGARRTGSPMKALTYAISVSLLGLFLDKSRSTGGSTRGSHCSSM